MRRQHTKQLMLLILSTFISGIGMSVFFMAANWFLHNNYHNTMDISIVTSSSSFILLLMLPSIGIICDTYSRKNILIIIYIIGVIFQLFLLYLQNTGKLNNQAGMFITLFIAINLITIIRSTDQIARSSYLHNIFDNKNYQNANRWLETTRQGITFIGGGLGALLFTTPSLRIILVFNIIAFILACLLMMILPHDNVTSHAHKNISLINRFKAGYNYLIQLDNNIILLLVTSILPYTLVVSLNVTYPAFFDSLKTQHNSTYYAALSIPYGFGALLAIRQKNQHKTLQIISLNIRLFLA